MTWAWTGNVDSKTTTIPIEFLEAMANLLCGLCFPLKPRASAAPLAALSACERSRGEVPAYRIRRKLSAKHVAPRGKSIKTEG
jgi:hypothetical protein